MTPDVSPELIAAARLLVEEMTQPDAARLRDSRRQRIWLLISDAVTDAPDPLLAAVDAYRGFIVMNAMRAASAVLPSDLWSIHAAYQIAAEHALSLTEI